MLSPMSDFVAVCSKNLIEQQMPLRFPCARLGSACCSCFCCFLAFFSNPNRGFDSSCKCCQDALYFQPILCLSCLLASEVAKLLHSMPLSSPLVSLTIFYCYFWFWSWLLSGQSSGFDKKCSL